MKLLKATAIAGILFCILMLLPYLRLRFFLPQNVEPFSGDQWYVPYQDIQDTLLKANFHAHSKSWCGITWGENSAAEMVNAYIGRGYAVPALSNYHKITSAEEFPSPAIYIPAYEHGVNTGKVHCLCIGAEDVGTLDFPWHFSTHCTNTVIQSLRKHCAFVALAHPGARNSHVPGDIPWLQGLDHMEVANTQGARTAFWDSTLSAGNPIWFLANDDTHALDDGEVFMRWNKIYADQPDAGSVMHALKTGNHYGILSYNGRCQENKLTQFEIRNDTLLVAMRDSFNIMEFFGQDGKRLHRVTQNMAGWYLLQYDDTYVRVEVHQDDCVQYFNPVIRFDGKTLPHHRDFSFAEDKVKTWIWRIGLLGVILGLCYVMIQLVKRMKR